MMVFDLQNVECVVTLRMEDQFSYLTFYRLQTFEPGGIEYELCAHALQVQYCMASPKEGPRPVRFSWLD